MYRHPWYLITRIARFGFSRLKIWRIIKGGWGKRRFIVDRGGWGFIVGCFKQSTSGRRRRRRRRLNELWWGGRRSVGLQRWRRRCSVTKRIQPAHQLREISWHLGRLIVCQSSGSDHWIKSCWWRWWYEIFVQVNPASTPKVIGSFPAISMGNHRANCADHQQ